MHHPRPTAWRVVVVLLAGALAWPALFSGPAQAQRGATGTIEGQVRLTGPAPPNRIIRMGADPACAADARARGGRPVQETVVRSADGGLANAFVYLSGDLPAAAAPGQPVTLDQEGCLFVPRVLGVQIGQVLQVRNSDHTGHNVHSITSKGNTFNVSQPVTGMVTRLPVTREEVMVRLRCDIHNWMVAYVGVVPHAYFAVSATSGRFRITNVPAGTYTLTVWHEQYGRQTHTVRVTAGGTTTLSPAYAGTEQPDTADIREFSVPATQMALAFDAGR